MTETKTYTVAHEDGTQSSRTSKVAYTTAVEIRTANGWSVLRWSKTPAAAFAAVKQCQRDAAKFADCADWATARIAPVK